MSDSHCHDMMTVDPLRQIICQSNAADPAACPGPGSDPCVPTTARPLLRRDHADMTGWRRRGTIAAAGGAVDDAPDQSEPHSPEPLRHRL